MKAHRGTVVALVVSLVAGLLLTLTPVAAQAQIPYATVVVWELQEVIDCNPGPVTGPFGDPLCQATSPAQALGTRLADATLVGLAWGVSAGEFTGSMSIMASSVVSQVDWTGPLRGKFALVQDPGVGAKTLTGTLAGTLDLSLLSRDVAPLPLAPVSGQWRGTKGTLQQGGTFQGVAQVPAECWRLTGGAIADGFCYLNPPTPDQPPTVEPLRPGFFPAGDFVNSPFGPLPLVRFVINLFAD